MCSIMYSGTKKTGNWSHISFLPCPSCFSQWDWSVTLISALLFRNLNVAIKAVWCELLQVLLGYPYLHRMFRTEA